MPSQAECAVSTLQSFDGSRLELGMKLFKGGLMSRPPHMNAVHEHVADLDTPVTMTWILLHTQQAFAERSETSVPNNISGLFVSLYATTTCAAQEQMAH